MLLHAPRTITVVPRCGLGNRLLCIASAVRLVELQLFDELGICWVPSRDLPLQSRAVLDLNFPHRFSNQNPADIQSIYTRLPANGLIKLEHRVVIEAYSAFTYYGDITPNDIAVQQLCTALDKIKFKPHYYAAATLDVAGRIGLHCRRSDYPQRITADTSEGRQQQHRQLDELFANNVAEHYPTQQLFLASDSASTTDYFSKRFGTRLVTVAKQHYPLGLSRPSPTMVESIIDMILLSRCSVIVSDSGSTYSLVASWFGKCPHFRWERPELL